MDSEAIKRIANAIGNNDQIFKITTEGIYVKNIKYQTVFTRDKDANLIYVYKDKVMYLKDGDDVCDSIFSRMDVFIDKLPENYGIAVKPEMIQLHKSQYDDIFAGNDEDGKVDVIDSIKETLVKNKPITDSIFKSQYKDHPVVMKKNIKLRAD